jgi:MYXO-CTERM domain-containing protein
MPDGRVIVVGGTSDAQHGESGALTATEAYDPISGAWVDMPSLNTARWQPSVAVLGGAVFVTGGTTATQSANIEFVASTEKLMPGPMAGDGGTSAAASQLPSGCTDGMDGGVASTDGGTDGAAATDADGTEGDAFGTDGLVATEEGGTEAAATGMASRSGGCNCSVQTPDADGNVVPLVIIVALMALGIRRRATVDIRFASMGNRSSASARETPSASTDL